MSALMLQMELRVTRATGVTFSYRLFIGYRIAVHNKETIVAEPFANWFDKMHLLRDDVPESLPVNHYEEMPD